MKYSVIVPSIGKSPFIEATLASIAAQDVEIELIVVDDAREDAYREIIHKCVSQCAARNAKIVRNMRRGLSAARNTGILSSSGDIIFFCDDDDTWSTDRVRVQSALLIATRADIHFANYRLIDTSGTILKNNLRECCDEFPETLNLRGFVPPSGWAANRSIFDRVGLFDERFRSTEDKEFFIRAASDARFVRSGPVLWEYRINPTSLSRQLAKKARYNAALIAKHRAVLFSNVRHTTSILDFSCKVFTAAGKFSLVCGIAAAVIMGNAKPLQKVQFICRIIAYRVMRSRIRRKVS